MFEKLVNSLLFLFCILSVIFILFAWNLPAYGVEITTTSITFQWSQVTEYCDGTPCDDLEGYALYRSRVSDQWRELNNIETAFALAPNAGTPKQQLTICAKKMESGIGH